jgi:uncharacterized membrane protein YoaK (UPF0700 family)
MFRHQGPGRSARANRMLAGYLALVGGFVNSAGFVIIGTFTSHVTGNVGRLSHDIATGGYSAAATAFTMLLAFFIGAVVASMVIESGAFGRAANAYATALFGEAVLLLTFTATSRITLATHPRLLDLEAAILCAAMGIQNSLVTSLSGAVVRTTHLTGVFTDIGIELARWFRWWRFEISRAGVRLVVGSNPPDRPSTMKITLLLTIAGGFTLGAILGSLTSVRFQHAAMLVPCAATIAGGIYALINGRAPDSTRASTFRGDPTHPSASATVPPERGK